MYGASDVRELRDVLVVEVADGGLTAVGDWIPVDYALFEPLLG